MRARWTITLLVATLTTACLPGGPATVCELPEPRCSQLAAQAAEWASISKPDLAVVRIRVLANGGYEVHYADGTSEAVVP